MNPNGKKVRDHRIAINLNHYEYQLIEAYSQLYGIEKSILVRQLLLRRLRDMLLQEQPIALLMPNTGTIRLPNGYNIVTQECAKSA